MNILTMSISGGAIILAVLLVRFFAKGRIPRRLILFLWGIAIIRLLIPFTIPFEYSIYSFLPDETTGAEVFPTKFESILFDPTAKPPQVEADRPTSLSNSNSGEQSAIPASKTAKADITSIVYISTVALTAVAFTTYYLYWRKRFKETSCGGFENEILCDWLAKNALLRKITVRLSSMVSAPLTYGIFCPVILMPEGTNWKNTEKLDYMLTHEYMHIKHFDLAKKLLLAVTLCLHWFNPLVWVMFVIAGRDIEFACDEAVIKSKGEMTRKAYALVLLDMEESRRDYVVFSNFSQNAVEQRVKSIINGKRRSVTAMIVACLITGCAFTLFATSAAAAHNGVGFDVVEVSATEEMPTESLGLEYKLINRGSAYSVCGLGECRDSEVVIPKEYKGLPVTAIDTLAFADQSGIVSVNIPETVTNIGDYAFFGVYSLRRIVVSPENPFFASDATGALYNKSVTELIAFPKGYYGEYSIPDGVTVITDSAFSNCVGLTQLYIPATVTGRLSITYCPLLKRIDVSPDNKEFSSDAEGILYDKSKTVLLEYPSARRGGYTTPESVKKVDSCAFTQATIDDLFLPNVSHLEEYALGASRITCLHLGKSIAYIGTFALISADGESSSVEHIVYDGTVEEWAKVENGFESDWRRSVSGGFLSFTINCKNGEIVCG